MKRNSNKSLIQSRADTT